MNAVAKPQETVKTLLARADYKTRFQEVLGRQAPQFMASISNAAQLPGIADCEPRSVVAAAFIAATLDLPIDRNLGFAWLIPYKTKVKEGNVWRERKLCQFQMGWKGFVQLAARSGQYERMNAFLVNKEALSGFDDCGEVEIDFEKLDETKEPLGYAFVWRLSNGFRKIVFWSKDKVMSHAARYSKAYDKSDSPWKSNFDAMALKTVVKNALAKWGVLSVQMRDAIKHDAASAIDIDSKVESADPIADPLLGAGEMVNAAGESEVEKPSDGEPGKEEVKQAESEKQQPESVSSAPVASSTPAATAGKHSPQHELMALVSGWSHTFATFITWAGRDGGLENADSFPSWDDVPSAFCKRMLLAQVGLKRGLDRTANPNDLKEAA